jgi:lysyl-tRNA synthetase class I
LLNTCPHHGFETWRLVSNFYERLTPKDRKMMELMCNRTFKDKDPDEPMEYLDSLVENAQNWDTTGTYEAPSKTQPHTSSEGMYNLREDHDLQAKFASLARKVEALELKKNGQLKSVQEIVVKSVKLMNTQPMIVQLCLLSRNVSMNKPML